MPESGSTRGGPSRVVTYFKFAASQLRRRGNQVRALDAEGSEAEQQRLLSALEAARGSAVREVRRIELDAKKDIWVGTGIRVNAGEAVTLFAWGVVWLSRLLGVGFEPSTALWVRVSGGPIRRMLSRAMTFRAQASGEIELFVKPPAEWLDEAGQIAPCPHRVAVSGTLTAVVAAWSGEPEQGLSALLGQPSLQPEAAVDSPVQQALANIRERPSLPAGWSYLWRVGEGQMFRAESHGGAKAVRCHTQGDVGILHFPVSVKLEPGTQLQWSWCVERLPSALPEHIQPTHDYLSIAAEFDNGQDLTYLWSSSLPEGYTFRCPLPWWHERETHMVVRTGASGLGQWVRQRRNLFEDYQRAIGGPLPARVVRVWFIAVSVFQRQPGVCSYRDITIGAGKHRKRVL